MQQYNDKDELARQTAGEFKRERERDRRGIAFRDGSIIDVCGGGRTTDFCTGIPTGTHSETPRSRRSLTTQASRRFAQTYMLARKANEVLVCAKQEVNIARAAVDERNGLCVNGESILRADRERAIAKVQAAPYLSKRQERLDSELNTQEDCWQSAELLVGTGSRMRSKGWRTQMKQ